MLSAGVVEALDVIEDHQSSGAFGLRAVTAEALGLESGYEALGEGVVIGVTRAAHAWGDVVESQLETEGGGGVLATAIAVMDEAGPDGVALPSSSEGGGDQGRGKIIAAVMSDDLSAAGIEGEGEVEPAFLSLDVSNVALPDLAWSIWRWDFGQPVRRNRMTMATIGCLRPEAALLPGANALFAHASSDPVLAAANTTIAQIVAQAWTAVVAETLLEALAQDGPQPGVLLAARPGGFAAMIVKAAFGTSRASASSSWEKQEVSRSITVYRCGASRPTRCPRLFLRSRAGDGGTRFPGADGAVRVAPGFPGSDGPIAVKADRSWPGGPSC